MPTLELHDDVLNTVYSDYLECDRRYQIFYGGASSGKSFFLAQRTVVDALRGRNVLVLRNVAKTLRGSCWNEIVKAIRAMELGDYFSISKTDLLITAVNNGCQIIFAGLDDVEKIKSITPARGVLTDVWVEEATEIAYEDYKQLDKRLRGASRHRKRLTLSFNPVYKEHWIFKEFFGSWDESKTSYQDEMLSILKTTYRDNRFLTPDDVHALESEQDPYYRDVYTLGNWGTLGDVILRNWKAQDLSEYARSADHLFFGLDFGFSSDPAAAVKVHYDKARKRIYVLDELYERGLVNQQLAELLKPFAGQGYITCDSSEPKSITELRNAGVKALPAKKGPDSVIHGVQWLQGHEIIVDTRCQHLRNELMLYQWRKDKDGNSLRVPEDRDNHLIDALRYALESESTARYATTINRARFGV